MGGRVSQHCSGTGVRPCSENYCTSASKLTSCSLQWCDLGVGYVLEPSDVALWRPALVKWA
jgi:hypothetical protein